MILDKKGNTSIITQEKATVVELVKKIDALYPKFKNDNIVVNLSSLNASIRRQDISEFLQISKTHKSSNLSFVLVTTKANVEDSPDEIVMVPTMQEAFDIIEMEEMERDLGI